MKANKCLGQRPYEVPKGDPGSLSFVSGGCTPYDKL